MKDRRKLAIPEPGGFWFFAYGSLMWDTPFTPETTLPARLFGWRRSFCVDSETYRGTRQNPGLSLGLDRGGSCMGLALRISATARETAIREIETRELEDDPIYICRQVNLHLPDRRTKGYALIVNRNDRIYTGSLTFEEQAQRIATARGSRGPNLEYLSNTVAQLERLGIPPGALGALYRRSSEIAGSKDTMAFRAGTR